MTYQRYNPLKRDTAPPERQIPYRKGRRGNRGVAPEIALARARRTISTSNYPTIMQGMMLKGIPEADIHPRENVFTFDAWKALGRCVRKGEHGVRISTMIPVGKHPEDAEETTAPGTPMRMWSTTVFHVSQTDALAEPAPKAVTADAPAAAVAQMAEAILKDKHLIVPASAYMQGEYGLKDMFFGAPVQLGRGGVERIVEYKLDADEKAALETSAAAVKESIEVMMGLVKI